MRNRRGRIWAFGLLVSVAFGIGWLNAQQPPEKKAPPQAAAAAGQPPPPGQPAPASPPAEKPLSITHHTITLNGRPLPYTATVGTLTVNKTDEQPGARIFFFAYTQDGLRDPASRPITFVFNGGPGSSSLWLHLGAWFHKKLEAKLQGEALRDVLKEAEPFPGPGRGRFGGLSVNVAEVLRRAMSENPFLQVFCANGYYDGATPYFGTEYTFSQMGLNGEFRDRIHMGYYEAGHMMYIHRPSHLKLKADLAEFMKRAAGK